MSGIGNDDAIAANMSSVMAVGEINFSSLSILSEEPSSRREGRMDKKAVNEKWTRSRCSATAAVVEAAAAAAARPSKSKGFACHLV